MVFVAVQHIHSIKMILKPLNYDSQLSNVFMPRHPSSNKVSAWFLAVMTSVVTWPWAAWPGQGCGILAFLVFNNSSISKLHKLTKPNKVEVIAHRKRLFYTHSDL